MKKKSFHIFLVCYAAYVFIYVARLNLSMAAPALKDLSILNTTQIGFLGSMFSVVYACGRLLSGRITDRNAPWKMISLGLILCGISNICIGLLPPFFAILLLWGVNAFAQSMLWGAILRILSEIYPADVAKKRASYMGTAVASGNLVAILLNTELINRFGPQWAFLVPGGITLLVCTLVILFTKHIDPPVPAANKNTNGSVLTHKGLRQMLFPAMVHGVMKDNISLWMTVYIMDRFGVDLEQSAYYILLIPIVGMIGRFVAPALYKFAKQQEKPLLLVSFGACVLGALVLTFFSVSAWVAILALSLIYMAVSVINACFLAIFPIQFAKTGHVATVSGIMDFATYLGAGIGSMIFGGMINAWGYNAMFITWGILSIAVTPLLLLNKQSKDQ